MSSSCLSPFHAAGGIMTARMLIHLQKTLALRPRKVYNAVLVHLDRTHPAESGTSGSDNMNEDPRATRAHRRADTESTLVDGVTAAQAKEALIHAGKDMDDRHCLL